MKKKLFSELRTIYKTNADDPHTFRLSMKLKDLVEGDILREAVSKTMERYPYFLVKMKREEKALYPMIRIPEE